MIRKGMHTRLTHVLNDRALARQVPLHSVVCKGHDYREAATLDQGVYP